jgi:hypothetical protein
MKLYLLALILLLGLVRAAVATGPDGSTSANSAHRKITPDRDVPRARSSVPSSVRSGTTGFVLRQDLFDRNNPNNLRSDWPGPPAQPGQF